MAENAGVEEEFQGEWTGLAPTVTAVQPEVRDGSAEAQAPSMPGQGFPTEDRSMPRVAEDWSAAPTAPATEWVRTTLSVQFLKFVPMYLLLVLIQPQLCGIVSQGHSLPRMCPFQDC